MQFTDSAQNVDYFLPNALSMADNTGDIIIFKSEDGSVHVDVVFSGDTVWLTMDSMAELFGKARSTITEHILNVFEEGELKEEEESVRKIGNSDFSNHHQLH